MREIFCLLVHSWSSCMAGVGARSFLVLKGCGEGPMARVQRSFFLNCHVYLLPWRLQWQIIYWSQAYLLFQRLISKGSHTHPSRFSCLVQWWSPSLGTPPSHIVETGVSLTSDSASVHRAWEPDDGSHTRVLATCVGDLAQAPPHTGQPWLWWAFEETASGWKLYLCLSLCFSN